MADTPNIRIEGFEDDWVEKQLGDLYIERNERGNDSLQILSVSIHSGVSDGELDEDGLGKVVRRSEDKSTYKHVYPGDLIFNMMRAWQGAIGVAKIEGMISPAYISAVPNDEVYPPFMDYLLRRKEVIDQINNLSYGVTDFRKRLYWDSFVKVKCFFPSVEEQKKIVHVLEELDKNISHQEKEVVGLKKLKQYLLQKMFPRDGEQVPEIRFEGYSDEWEERKISDIAEIVGGGTPDTNYPAYWDGEIDWYSPAEMEGLRYANSSVRKITELGLQKSSAKVLPAHKTVLFTSRAGIGKMAILQRPAATNQGFQSLIVNDETDPYFIYSMEHRIKKMAESIASGSTFLEISGKMLGNLVVMLPTLKEQKEIATFFRGVDDLIILHQRKCDALKNLKAYLLQNMFPKEEG